jgi:hypothetical protein
MLTRTVHSFDDDDGGAFGQNRAAEMLSLLSGSVDGPASRALEAGIRDPAGLDPEDHASLRAARKIAANAFETQDVEAFLRYIAVLAARHRATATALEREGGDRRMVTGIRETAATAESMADAFRCAFNACAGQAPILPQPQTAGRATSTESGRPGVPCR